MVGDISSCLHITHYLFRNLLAASEVHLVPTLWKIFSLPIFGSAFGIILGAQGSGFNTANTDWPLIKLQMLLLAMLLTYDNGTEEFSNRDRISLLFHCPWAHNWKVRPPQSRKE